jgi:hypothetical protein
VTPSNEDPPHGATPASRLGILVALDSAKRDQRRADRMVWIACLIAVAIILFVFRDVLS